MATGDLWYNKFNCSTNNRAWSFSMWTEETTPLTPANDGNVMSRLLNAHLGTALLNILGVQSFYESVQSWKRWAGSSRPGFVIRQGSPGTRTGDAMSNDNCLFINLRQSFADAKYNGGIYISGQSDSDHTANKWTDAYLNGAVTAFTDLLDGFINAVGPDTGQARIVVVSKTFQPPSSPVGTNMDVVEAKATDRVMTQRRRRQKNRGFATTTS
jgi:hypothetical protein